MTTDITASASATATISLGSSTAGAVDNPSHASTSMQNGQAVFENDSYRITANDDNTVTIQNKQTGESYQASGDPHVSVDGEHAFDFWGTTTFKLDDGTKVTIQTKPSDNNPGATLSSKVTITNGDYGVQITGVDGDTHGDLQIHEAKGWGHTLDWAVDDGNTLQENPNGPGFLAVDKQGNIHAVDQKWINQTDEVKNPGGQQGGAQQGGGNELANFFKGAFHMLSSLASIAFLGGFRAGERFAGNDDGASTGSHHGGANFGFQPWQGGNLFLNGSITLTERVSLTLSRHPG